MINYDAILTYSDPGPDGKGQVVEVTVREAMRQARCYAESYGGIVSDEWALEEFMVIHWAEYKDDAVAVDAFPWETDGAER